MHGGICFRALVLVVAFLCGIWVWVFFSLRVFLFRKHFEQSLTVNSNWQDSGTACKVKNNQIAILSPFADSMLYRFLHKSLGGNHLPCIPSPRFVVCVLWNHLEVGQPLRVRAAEKRLLCFLNGSNFRSWSWFQFRKIVCGDDRK